MKVKETDNHNIACCVRDLRTGKKWIEMNKYLKEDPILYKAVLEHEKEHLVSKHKYIDFWLDLKPKQYSWRLFKWTLRHPKLLLPYFPISIEKGRITIDLYSLILLLIILCLIVPIIFLWRMVL